MTGDVTVTVTLLQPERLKAELNGLARPIAGPLFAKEELVLDRGERP